MQESVRILLTVDIRTARQSHLYQERPGSSCDGGQGEDKNIDSTPLWSLKDHVRCGPFDDVRIGPIWYDHDEVSGSLQCTLLGFAGLKKPNILDWKSPNQCGEKLLRTILNRIHAPLHKPYVSGKPRSTRRSKEREIEAREGVSRILWSAIPLLAGVVAREERVNGLNGLTLVRSGGFNLKGRPKARAKNQYADHASGVCHFSSQSADNARPEPRGDLGDSSRSAQMNTLFPWNSNNSGPHPN